jgi:hypothetical protein
MRGTAIGSAPGRVSPYGAVATGPPIASTCVAGRSPVIQLLSGRLHRRTARDARHSDWVGAWPCVDVWIRGDGAPDREHVRRAPFSGDPVLDRPALTRLAWILGDG